MKFTTSENGSSMGLEVMWLHLDSVAVSYMLLPTILPFPFPFSQGACIVTVKKG